MTLKLFQIEEPSDEFSHSVESLKYVGIDLGTTHSLIAYANDQGVFCLPDKQGQVLLPSIVSYDTQGLAVVGDPSDLIQSNIPPVLKVVSVKRLMGKKLSEVGTSLPYQIVDHPSYPGSIGIKTPAGVKSPIEVSANILLELKNRFLASYVGSHIAGIVLTVPAYYDDAQRQATKDAALLAGLPVLRLLNEPTAAAMYYGLDSGRDGLYVIYDLGGGTFDVSILKLQNGFFEVIGVGGDSALGGDDFDLAVVDYVRKALQLAPLGWSELAPWRLEARRCREYLSAHPSTEFKVTQNHHTHVLDLSYAQLAEICQELVNKTLQIVHHTLYAAKVNKDNIDGVVLVGGCTRMPQIKTAVKKYFSKPVLDDINPDEVVALGAALQAKKLSGESNLTLPLLIDVVPLSLGIETVGELVEKIIHRHQPIPITIKKEFTTSVDGQTGIWIHVVQGERELVPECRSLGRFELKNLTPKKAGTLRIEVEFDLDSNNLLTVRAKEKGSLQQTEIRVQPSYGLTKEQIQTMLTEFAANAEKDAQKKYTIELQNEATDLLQWLQKEQVKDADSLSTEQQHKREYWVSPQALS
ncbi:MAG: Fe-S protein assembly chaperone HscA, partial [Gammaproteobacteria bacterium]|nr:Fe-S protein assembly chaperone HscA [Gammaproteobacteria bacterium]